MSENTKCARFVTTLPASNVSAGRRAAHYVYPDNGGYSHTVRFIVDKDFTLPAEWGDNVYLSERVFFGRWRYVEVFETHTPETWMAIGMCVERFESEEPINPDRPIVHTHIRLGHIKKKEK